jgi:hypothetical protein
MHFSLVDNLICYSMHYPQEVLGRILEEARRATPGDEVPKSITLLVEDLVAAAGSKTIVDFVPYYHLR